MIYRIARLEDFEEIAILHAHSWSTFYRNIFTDNYLDHEVLPDRLAVWEKRAETVEANRHIIVAEENERIIGFACTYLDHPSGNGSLLDNLHVLENHQGRGIGIAFMQKSFDWIQKESPNQLMYLTVLTENHKSKDFYYRFGGKFEEEYIEKTPYGALVPVERISWAERPKLTPL